MSSRLPIFTPVLWSIAAAWVLAQPPIAEPARATKPPEPMRLIHQAIAALEAHQGVEARVTLLARLFDQRLSGSGIYVQGPPGSSLMRFEFQLQVGNQSSSLLEVCDGRYLWTRRHDVGASWLTRLDVSRVYHAQRLVAADPQSFRPRLSMAGLRRQIDALVASFEFQTAEAGVFDGKRVWNLRGEWKPAQLAMLSPAGETAAEPRSPVELARWGEHVPDHVILTLGTGDVFPYRIDYRRGEASAVLIKMLDVQFDRPLDEGMFRYRPADQPVVDVTDRYVRGDKLTQ